VFLFVATTRVFTFFGSRSISPHLVGTPCGAGLAHYLADTPNGAWTEFARHEEMTELADLAGVRRGICARDIDHREWEEAALPMTLLTEDELTYADCQRGGRVERVWFARLVAPSAALRPGAASGLIVDSGMQDVPTATVLFAQCLAHGRISWVGVSRRSKTAGGDSGPGPALLK
jgi:hypothetical protein